MKDEQFAKLPKWAQQEFHLLLGKLNSANEENALLRGDRVTRIYARNALDENRNPIDDNATVVFEVDDNEALEIRFSRDHQGRIEIRSNGFRSRGIDVRPHVTNVFTVGVVK